MAALLGNSALYYFGPAYYRALWAVGAILVLFGLRLFDRRVKLRIAPHGILYAQWGSECHPWNEFESFSVFVYRGFPFINIPQIVKLGALINQLARRPGYYINPSQLEASVQSILEALRAHAVVRA